MPAVTPQVPYPIVISFEDFPGADIPFALGTTSSAELP